MSQPPANAYLPLALLLARISLVNAFRRSGLGPLWSSVGVLVAVGTVGLLFGTMLRSLLISFEDYISTLAAGLVMWTFLAAVANDSAIAFARWMPILRHSRISMPVIALSVLLRHLPVLGLNIALLIVLQHAVLGRAVEPLPMLGAVLLLVANVYWIGALAFVLGARFRDIGQLVPAVIQLAFLLTPILWPPYFLGRFEYLLSFNPFYFQFSILMAAAAGIQVPSYHWITAMGLAVAGGALTLGVYRWSKFRWPYWI
ncbi:O-antigen export system permease protein RfbD [Paramagnetospirillum magnetotacticum MS-1]|uniref:O-antigen export system permease protein RfbD n=1 Tax=Paramagnetospirillum magnetotacticum MS-1 TaxID=272627 RepID=A0A0C2UDP0_PARME|nr:ABC transporter permease [Paramagnetospirillum magnetotacticum]KIL99587.1 O-antigen export system permease protein RfbD [Paramagnetospirillum magnetotacticum MS-1]